MILPILIAGVLAAQDGACDVCVERHWSVRAELVSDLPLPYQAIRIRKHYANCTSEPQGECYDSECMRIFRWIQEPGSTVFRKIASPCESEIVGTPLSVEKSRVPLVLKPGDETSFSRISSSDDTDNGRVPLFPVPGVYRIRWTEEPGGKDGLEVRVADPIGKDAIVFRKLQQQPSLALAVMSCRNVADEPTAHKLAAIEKELPDSGYSDYIHFALARAKLQGVELWEIARRTQEDRDAALRELRKIKNPRFAYRANTLMLELRLLFQTWVEDQPKMPNRPIGKTKRTGKRTGHKFSYEIDGTVETRELARHLARDYWDSDVWLNYRDSVIAKEDGGTWYWFRVRKAPCDKPTHP